MRRWAFVGAFAILLFAALFGLAALTKAYQLDNEVSLPLLAIAGVMALIGALALVAIGFSMMSLSDRTQALGLPKGSVRAVIALSLVVLFAILTVYLFSALNKGDAVRSVPCLSQRKLDDFVRSLQPGQLISSAQGMPTEGGQSCGAPAPAKTAEGKPAPSEASAATANGTPPEPLYVVYFRDLPNPAGQDFAKQLLVLIGTLVTSVAGFYFGSKAASDAQSGSRRSDPPSLVSVEPTAINGGGAGAVAVKITGSGLNSVRQAQLASGDLRITDGSVVSNAGQVLARFNVPAGTPAGPWDVVVIDSDGRQCRIPGAVKVRGAADDVRIAGAAPTAIGRGQTAALTVSGTGLESVTQVQLTVSGKRILGTKVSASATKVTATFQAPDDAPLGFWDVELSDGASAKAVAADLVLMIGAPPSPKSVLPSQLIAGTPSALAVSGSDLEHVVGLRIVSPSKASFEASDLVASSGSVTGNLTVKGKEAPLEAWDLIVTDMANRSVPLPKALLVT